MWNSLWRACLLVLLLFPASAFARLDQYPDFKSAYVDARNVTVWVPDDYDPAGPPLPVIYMQDGQNAFDPATSYGGHEWGLDEAMIAAGRRAIIVGIWNTKKRGREYLPAKVWGNLSEQAQQTIAGFHGGPPVSDNYLKFLVRELKPFVDKRYRTLTDRRHTSIMGSSMGGLISLYAMGEYPKVFGTAVAVSIHWPLAVPGTAEPADVGQAFDRWMRGAKLKPGVNRLYIDRGTKTLDASYPPYAAVMAPVLASRGWRDGPGYQNLVIDGAEHNETSWRARAAALLAFALEAGQ